ncbi:MAG: tRNA lysidine(34) synthetase TilS [Vicinamibacterales bacterium]
MRRPLLDRIQRHVDRHGLWRQDTRVVAALSGGADSVAQLLVLRDLAAAGRLVLAGAAHLNHRLRPEADADEAFCRDLCARLDVPFVARDADVAALAAEWQTSIEAAARRARYAFLDEARRALQADRIAVAHTEDDQAETVLLRLLRGAGTRGLRGILPLRGRVVRPLLSCSRADLRTHLAACGETWREDASNADLALPRNRVRHELLPLLSRHYQPAVTRLLARTAEVADAEDALLEALAAEAAGSVVSGTAAAPVISASRLKALPLALARRVVRRTLEAAGAPRGATLADVEAVLTVSGRHGPRAAWAAGLRVERFSADAVLLIRTPAPPPVTALPVRTLPVPGVVDLPEAGPTCRLRAERPIEGTRPVEGVGPRVALKGTVPTPLTVRSRRPGDRLRPVGLGGSKKVQDLLVDRKVARGIRDLVPVVTDASGRIVWVAGHAADADAVAVAPAGDVIVLTFEPPDVPGSEG